MNVGFSPIPSREFLQELAEDDFRNEFVADHLRTRTALLIRSIREQRGWSQAELGRRLGKPQSVISRLEDPDYGKVTLQTLFEVAAAFGLPLYIDMPNWDDWFHLMQDMSRRNFQRDSFDAGCLAKYDQQTRATVSENIIWAPSIFGIGAAAFKVIGSDPNRVATTFVASYPKPDTATTAVIAYRADAGAIKRRESLMDRLKLWDLYILLPAKLPKAVEDFADTVLRYRPKPKSEPAKKRRRRAKKLEKARV